MNVQENVVLQMTKDNVIERIQMGSLGHLNALE